MKQELKDWLSVKETDWGKHVKYPNREKVMHYIIIAVVIITLSTYMLIPDVNVFFIGLIVGVGFWILWTVIIQFRYVESYPVIAKEVRHVVNGTPMTMYQVKWLLFYTIDDIDSYFKGETKDIEYISIKPKED